MWSPWALLPPVYSVVTAAGLWAVYFLAVNEEKIAPLGSTYRRSNGSLYPPYISIAGNFAPASCIFSEVMNLAAFVGEVTIQVCWLRPDVCCCFIFRPHSRVRHRRPQVPAAEAPDGPTLAERRQLGGLLRRLLRDDARGELPAFQRGTDAQLRHVPDVRPGDAVLLGPVLRHPEGQPEERGQEGRRPPLPVVRLHHALHDPLLLADGSAAPRARGAVPVGAGHVLPRLPRHLRHRVPSLPLPGGVHGGPLRRVPVPTGWAVGTTETQFIYRHRGYRFTTHV